LVVRSERRAVAESVGDLRCAGNADQRLQYQQNISKFNIGIVVIAARDTRLPHLQLLVAQLKDAIIAVAPGTVVVVNTA
jgi:hypothetical protein